MAGRGTDVVVVGGGVIGLSTAWMAAEEGLGVTLVDPHPGRGASWVAAGMLAPVTEAAFGEEPLTRLLVAAAGRWPAFATRLHEASGCEIGYRACGTVVVALDASDRAAVDQLLELHGRLGLGSTRLSASACRAAVPALSPAVRGGAEVPGDHQVDNRLLLVALMAAVRRSGVRMVEVAASALRPGPRGGVRGVVLADGTDIPADMVVLAAGAAFPGLDGLAPGVIPPVRPVKGHVVRLRGSPEHPLLDRTVRGLVHGRPCYLVPRADGSLVVGATSEERGYDTSVQAGAVHSLLDDARSLVPGIDELVLEECLAGLRPAAPDNGPVVGWTAMPGLAVATGHFRNGILLAPLTAEALAGILADRSVRGELAGWGPERFGPARSDVA